MADFIFKISPNIVLGSYTVSRLGQYALELGDRFLVIMDPVLRESEVALKVTDALAEKNVGYFIFDEISSTASSETVKSALKLAQDARVQGVIAVGGGKTLSVGRAVCTLYYEEEKNIYDYIDENLVPPKKLLPLICLPSTSRDNFLFTDRIFMTDERSGKAKLIKTQNGLCKLVLWDPNLQTALTEKQSFCMAMEILSFAIEGYLSQKSTFFSDMIIEKAVQLLGYSLDGADTLTVTTPAEVLLAESGCMASLGSSTSSFGASSLISLVINSRYKTSRSLVSAILLPYIIEDGSTFKAEKLAVLSHLINASKSDDSVESSCVALVDYVRQKIAKINLPSRLKDLSLSIEQLSFAAEDAGELDLINSLQRSMTTDDLFELVKKAY